MEKLNNTAKVLEEIYDELFKITNEDLVRVLYSVDNVKSAIKMASSYVDSINPIGEEMITIDSSYKVIGAVVEILERRADDICSQLADLYRKLEKVI